jgi:tRNA A64-2'-O-ribosylphosphate transferase
MPTTCTTAVEESVNAHTLPGWREKRERQREINRARNRLFSVQHDVDCFLKPLLRNAKASTPIMKGWPLLANQRCGAWYTGPLTTSSCYFKSVDGHVGTWNFSLKRLNLHVLRTVSKTGGCWIVDASRTKMLPDSLSRAIPIWAAVLNRIVTRFRRERGLMWPENGYDWDEDLHTPSMISAEEHDTILGFLDARVEELYSSGVILHPEEIIDMMRKPLRPVWITDASPCEQELERLKALAQTSFLLVCVSCGGSTGSDEQNMTGFLYSPGAADDEESWARGLTPQLFWKHKKAILRGISDDDTDKIIDEIVQERAKEEDSLSSETSYAQSLAFTGFSVGSRKAGRPPSCWDNFDAILNVTTTEYSELGDSSEMPAGKYYMQLPVEEGKRDKTELERWLAVGIAFIVYHIAGGRRVLVHCAQGKDRSVAIAIGVVVLFCRAEKSDLRFRTDVDQIKTLTSRWDDDDEGGSSNLYKFSGLTCACVKNLLGRHGRDTFIEWFRDTFPDFPDNAPGQPLASKSSLRIALHAIQSYRLDASPSRSSMQKLNRFFMSADYEE